MPLAKLKVRLICEKCGAEFEVQPHRATRAKYCGLSCKQSAITRARNFSNRGTGIGYVKFNGRHEHRIVAESKLGRSLLPGEIVHHIDGNKKNNSPDNLSVMFQSEHVRLHRAQMAAARFAKHGY